MASSPPQGPAPLRRVFQQHEDGCGIACVAMLAGLSYEDARHTIFGSTEADATSFEDLRWALADHGVRVARRLTPFWEGWYTQLREPALLALNPMVSGMWHWAVWDAENLRILDPLRWPPRPLVVGYATVAPTGRRRTKRPRANDAAEIVPLVSRRCAAGHPEAARAVSRRVVAP